MKSISWIGVDVSKDSFHAAGRQGTGFCETEFGQDDAGMQAFVQWLPQGGNLQVVLESTGPYWQSLVAFLHSLPQPVRCCVVNPRRVRDFAKASGQYSKTDPLDARLLVHFGETFPLQALEVQKQAYHHLRAFSRHYLQLRNHYDTIRDQRDKALADPHAPVALQASYDTLLKALKSQMEGILGEIEQSLQQPALQEAAGLLQSIPGIGTKTTATLLGEYGSDALNYSIKQWESFAGLDVVLWESGTSVRKKPRISKQGNWRVRRALYFAAMVASRHNPTVRAYYQRLLNRGEEKKAALVACMRKLLQISHGVLKNQTPFQEMTNAT
jgi:transposase